MNIISIDLPWKSATVNHRALAIANNLNGESSIEVVVVNDDEELLQRVKDNIEQEAIVLLDIPIEGCMQSRHFRFVDKALSCQGVWTMPIPDDKGRGKRLKGDILNLTQGRGLTVLEIYPYAVYKFLAYLECHGLLPRFGKGGFDALLEDKFRRFRPPKYKRERTEDKRLENMRYLYSLLTDSNIGLNFSPPLDYPDSSYTLNQLKNLADRYDACLGAIAGICWTKASPYAWMAGDPELGRILLLADEWLKEQLRQYIPMGRETECL